jgi:hypothetical protein
MQLQKLPFHHDMISVRLLNRTLQTYDETGRLILDLLICQLQCQDVHKIKGLISYT